MSVVFNFGSVMFGRRISFNQAVVVDVAEQKAVPAMKIILNFQECRHNMDNVHQAIESSGGDVYHLKRNQ